MTMERDRPLPTSVESVGAAGKGDLSPHDQKVIDYTLQAVSAANNAKAEELIARTRNVITTEINQAFTQYTNLTTGRRIAMAVAGLAAFGLGFLVKGWVGTRSMDEPQANGVHPE